MENSYQENEETIEIFKEECEEILKDFVFQLEEYEKSKDVNIITKLMRDAHSIKGSASIVGLSKVQKLAHKTEDILALLKTNEIPQGKTEQELIFEIKLMLNDITTEISDSNNFIENENEIYENILKNIPRLKDDITVISDLQKDTQNLLQKCDKPKIAEIITSVYDIFSKVKSCSDLNKSMITTLAGAFKILKRLQDSDTAEANEELFFLKQRLSVVSQMFRPSATVETTAVQTSPIISKPAVAPVQTAQKEAGNIFNILGQNSIKTLRIETKKVDELYQNVCHLSDIAESSRDVHKKLLEITENLSTKIFEFEKNIAKMKQIYDNDELPKEKLADALRYEILQTEKNLFDIQDLMGECCEYNSKKNETYCVFDDGIKQVKTTVKNIRILPIGVILHMFPRMVRDIAVSENKEVDMEISGSETGVDKKILEELKMPLLHLLRNAIDHGIETTEERLAKQKNSAGKITLCAKNEKDNFVISVKDDGCGINFDKIKEKALKEKLLGKVELNKYRKHDFLQILFRPGFSTEDKITEISGRGMGLDIVYTKISALNGQIKVNTEKDKGTEFVIKIPTAFKDSSCCITKKKPTENKKILLTDDSKTSAMYFSRILKKAGYEVSTCLNGKKALKELKNNKYDMLITDIEMPEMDGAELVLRMRKDKNLKTMPVIVISMLPKEKSTQLFKNLDVIDTISKVDFDENKMVEQIKKSLE